MRDLTRLQQLLINDNGFAFDPATGETYHISRSGLDVIRWLKEGKSGRDVLDRLVTRYEVDEPTAARDLEGFMATLRSYGLIERDTEDGDGRGDRAAQR